MEDKVINTAIENLRNTIPSAQVTLIESKIGEGFWSFEINDGLVNGSGASSNTQIAFNKALSEFVERHAVKTYSGQLGTKTSSGFAAHLDEKSAHEASIGELIERDAFLACWFAKVPPAWLNFDQLSFDTSTSEILSTILGSGIRIKFGFLAKSGNYTIAAGMISFAEYTNQKAAYGFVTEADTTVAGALSKVAFSLFRIANLVITRKTRNVDLFEEITADKIKHPYHHLEYYLNPQNISSIEEWWESKSSQVLEIEESTMHSQLLSHPLADSMGRKVSYTKSSRLLNYFCGTTVEVESIKNRLHSLGLNLKQNPEIPHPLS